MVPINLPYTLFIKIYIKFRVIKSLQANIVNYPTPLHKNQNIYQ